MILLKLAFSALNSKQNCSPEKWQVSPCQQRLQKGLWPLRTGKSGVQSKQLI